MKRWFPGRFERGEAFDLHCFVDDRGIFYDEYGNKLSRRREPCGEYGLDSYLTIDDRISTALGIPLAP